MIIQLDPTKLIFRRSLFIKEGDKKKCVAYILLHSKFYQGPRVLDFPREFRSNRETFPREEH